MEVNKIYHLDNREGLKMLPEKCANLIISDPPYFEVKGEFDFVWKSFDEYLEFMEDQAQLYKRILADNGTLFVWAYVKHRAYIQVIFDKYFNLENDITWIKKDGMQYQYYSIDSARIFTPNNERILMYSNEDDILFKGEIGYCFFQPIVDRLKSERGNKSLKDLSASSGIKETQLSHYFRKDANGWCLPSQKELDQLGFQLNAEKLREEYQLLKKEYEDKRRLFFNDLKLSDCMEFSQEGHITKQFEHETKKPQKLTRALIRTCSRLNDLVVVPFAGSGTECAMAAKEGRRFIGFDNKNEYVEMANKRVNNILKQPALFQ